MTEPKSPRFRRDLGEKKVNRGNAGKGRPKGSKNKRTTALHEPELAGEPNDEK